MVVPDHYRGKMQTLEHGMDKVVEFIKAETDWAKIKAEFEATVRPYAERHGAKVFGTIGEMTKLA